jgi:ATP-dependent exoDNAse (exonuclease V) beta subunit
MENIYEKLKIFDDPLFTFNEDEHVYRYGNKKLPSVTTYLKKFYKEFDAEHWSKVIAQRENVDVSVILQRWDEKRDTACDMGTEVHKYIEERFTPNSLITRADFTNEETLLRIDKFEKLYDTRLHKLTPIAQEIRVFSTTMGIAGTIDALFMIDGKLLILDWKTNGKFRTDRDKNYSKLNAPFHQLWDNEHNKYSIQLNLYKLILAEHGIPVSDCVIVYIPPSDNEPKVIKTKDVYGLLKAYFGVDY